MTDYVLFDTTNSVHPDYNSEIIGILKAKDRPAIKLAVARLFPKKKVYPVAWLYAAPGDRQTAINRGRIGEVPVCAN